MRTDSLFYEIFQTAPGIVFELIGMTSLRNLAYRFASQEIKQTSFRIDGILLPEIADPDFPIVFVEVQGYKDTKGTLYSSFFSEIFLYLHDYQPIHDWCAVLIFLKHSLDPGLPRHYQDFANSPRFHRIYLDELNQTSDLSLGLSLLQLIVLPPEEASERGRMLINRTRQELGDPQAQQKFVQLVETVFVYKFPELSREVIEAMFELSDLKQTRVYQEALEEGREEGKIQAKQELVPRLLSQGLSLEAIAHLLELDLEQVRQTAGQ
jgi:predicted transposase/invertase (TIGR01784 family)